MERNIKQEQQALKTYTEKYGVNPNFKDPISKARFASLAYSKELPKEYMDNSVDVNEYNRLTGKIDKNVPINIPNTKNGALQEMTDINQRMGQIGSGGLLRLIEKGLQEKQNQIGENSFGTSKLYERAGLPQSYATLTQSLNQRGAELGQDISDIRNLLSDANIAQKTELAGLTARLNAAQTKYNEFKDNEKELSDMYKSLATNMAQNGIKLPTSFSKYLGADIYNAFNLFAQSARDEKIQAGLKETGTGTYNPLTGNYEINVPDSEAADILKAMAMVESGEDYNKVGDNGISFGKYQFQKGTWDQMIKQINADAKKNGINPDDIYAMKEKYGVYTNPDGEISLEDPRNQDAVALWKVKDLQSKGWDAREIGMIWNTSLGSDKEYPYERKGSKIVNNKELKYDSMAHGDKVLNNLLKIQKQKGESQGMADSSTIEQIISVIPSNLRDTASSRASYEKVIKEGLSKNKKPYQIQQELLGYKIDKPTNVSEKVSTILSSVPFTQDQIKTIYPRMAGLLNNGNDKEAIKLLENESNLAYKKGVPTNEYINESKILASTQATNELLGLVSQLEKTGNDTLGAFNGTFQEFLGKFKSKKAQQIITKITRLVSKMRLELSGTAVTDSEKKFLEPIIPDLMDSTENIVVKLQELKTTPLREFNAQRTVIGLPEINENELLNFDSRVNKYKETLSNTTDATEIEGIKKKYNITY